ncbi:hypothetical protein LJC31_00410, partial [Synergistaceae bacterium OttesenSCG-928-I11]|nr:hypothetical protein [Synergistaceae bacterium OttesenSCG-928-I11]
MNGHQMPNPNEPEAQPGPQVIGSKKKTKFFSKRVIFFFVFGVGVVMGIIGMQSRFDASSSGAGKQEKNYLPPRQENFAELAAGMRQDRKPMQVVTAPAPEPEKKPQRIVVEEGRAPQPVRQPLPRYYSNRDDAQAANTLRTLRLQALAAKPVVEDFARKGADSAPASGNPAVANATGVESGLLGDPSMLSVLMQQPQGTQNPNGQQGKQDFFRASNGGGSLTPQGYSQNIPLPRQFTYELKAGTIIPGLLLT